MIADSERREVARRLREVNPYRNRSYTVPYNRYTPAAEYLCKLAGALGYSPENDVSRLEFQNRLADLIEPEPERTCRVESSHEEEGDGCYSYFEYELTCGHEIAWEDQLPPRYCPKCGRRVLYDCTDYI